MRPLQDLALRLSTYQVHASILGWSYCKGVEFVWGRKGALDDSLQLLLLLAVLLLVVEDLWGWLGWIQLPLEVQQLHAVTSLPRVLHPSRTPLHLMKNGFVSWCCRVVGELIHRRQAASTLWERWDHRSHLELHYYSYRWWFSLDFFDVHLKIWRAIPTSLICSNLVGLDDQFVLRDDQLWCVSHDESHQATIMSVLHRSVGWSCCG